MNWNCLRSGFLLFASLLVVALGLPDAAHANNIYVTSLLDKISAEGGCSLKEAIYSSNFHSNVAVARYTDPISGDPVLISTQCLPGSGNDTIILPTGQVLSITAAVFDANNISGPTATPFYHLQHHHRGQRRHHSVRGRPRYRSRNRVYE